MIYCNKCAGHEGEHDCLIKDLHLCNKPCDLAMVVGCQKKCSLPYGHVECSHPYDKNKFNDILFQNFNHLCSGKHICPKKCIFSDYDCILEYGHKGECFYQREHKCSKPCEENGICEIVPAIISKNIKVTLRSGEEINYVQEDEQIPINHQCILDIPSKKLDHKGNHKCHMEQHKCGYRCKQCKRMCDLIIGHKGKHYIKNHGHIINANIFTEENNLRLNFQDREYYFQNEDSAEMYTCVNYCKQQGRGHIHILGREEFENINNFGELIDNNSARKTNNNLYECKCEFFWKTYLQFDFYNERNVERNDERDLFNIFNRCPALCPLCKGNNINQYCEGDLWHGDISNLDNNNDRFWVSQEGHIFRCNHPIPIHTIFIIDKSGSMSRSDISPKIPSISSNADFKNRMGKLIENMYNYINKRVNDNNLNDVFSLITFSDEAKIIFNNNRINFGENFNFINECIKRIGKCKGETYFSLGFNEAENILNNIDRRRYKPVIILFSDGEDQKMTETIKIVKRVST